MIDIRSYTPGRFAYLMSEDFAQDLWNFVSSEKNIAAMITAIEQRQLPIGPLLTELESTYEPYLSSPDYPEEEICVFTNNMIKQILEMKGYTHTGCGLLPRGKYFKSSGLYTKKQPL